MKLKMKRIFLILLLISAITYAGEWTGTVIGITDGDTATVLNAENQSIKVRLVEIDAPESKQAFGNRAKQSLAELCFKKPVVVMDKGHDRYKRTLGRLICDGVDANAEQVKRGMAWAYRKYLKDSSILDLETLAKNGQVGLWADINPTPPWEFRHPHKPLNQE
jgi:endonuclease YncB( thermonuclease family)